MTLTKEAQYAILFCMYLCNAGRATVDAASKNMGLSRSFLDQIARKLRIAEMITSTRGPGGGFSLVSREITLYDILAALGVDIGLLGPDDLIKHQYGSTEQRSFARLAFIHKRAAYQLWDLKLVDILSGLAVEDKAKLDSLSDEGVMQ